MENIPSSTAPWEAAPIDEGAKNYWWLGLSVFPVFTFLGNVLVLVAVFTQRSLRTSTNYYIASLGVADLLVAVFVMPFGVYYLYAGTWDLPDGWCDFYIFADVTCSTASVFNLVAISFDRYFAVIRPISYAKHRNLKRVVIIISLAWSLSILIGLPILLGINNTPDRLKNECVFNSKLYVLFSSSVSFGLPCILMMYLYLKIFLAIRGRRRRQMMCGRFPPVLHLPMGLPPEIVIDNKSSSQERRRSVQDERTSNTASDEEYYASSMPGASGGDPKKTTRLLMAAVVEETGIIMANLASPIPMTEPIETTTNIDSGYVASNMGLDHSDDIVKDTQKPHALPKIGVVAKKRKLTIPRQNPLKTAAAKLAFLKAHRRQRQTNSMARMEQRATQTLLIVIGVFLLCWLPFFGYSMFDACNIVFNLGYKMDHSMPYFMTSTWFGYINSAINPLIYTIFNQEFRKAFKKLLRL